MYADLYGIIVAKLIALGLVNVDTALGPEPPLPAIQVYLVNDDEVKTKTISIRQLSWGIKVTVGHDETTGAAQTEILGLLDTIRDGFTGWLPATCVGIQNGFTVKTVSIEDFKDHGSAVYVALLTVRVVPETFKSL